MAKALRFSSFAGMVPRLGRRLLQESQAQVATNVRLTSGQLAPLRDVVFVNEPNLTGIVSIYKMVQDGVDYWLAWNVDVDVAKGPIAGDQTNRTYFTGDNEPRVTNITLATGSTPYPSSWYVLGVTSPITAASVSHAGGAGTSVDRTFVYTFVTPWGEESAPSPVSPVATGKTDGTWTVSGMNVAPLNTFAVTGASWLSGTATLTVASTFGLRVGEEIAVAGVNPSGYNTTSALITAATSTTVSYAVAADPGAYVSGGTITRASPHNTTGMTKNIYWSETTVSGTKFQLVKSGVAVADTSTNVAGNVTPGEEIITTTWEMPPTDMKGIVFHPSGAAVGFSKNQLLFSEPYAPYAWPTEYRFTVDHSIVGIGIFGTTVVVTTDGAPYVASGIDPDSIALTQTELPWPCLAKRGVVSMGYGVLYPAPQGLVLIGTDGASLLTQDLYTQEEWEELNPTSFRAVAHSNRYVASYAPTNDTRRLLIIDRSEYATVTVANKHCDALYEDGERLYVVNADDILEWDANTGAYLTYDWMSKEIVAPEVFNPGAAKVDAEFTLTPEEVADLQVARTAAIAANQAVISAETWDAEGSLAAVADYELGGPSFDAAPDAPPDELQFQMWINNELKFNKPLSSSRAFRLPAGYKADALAVRITGNVKVQAVVVGETMLSLKAA